MPAQIAYQYCTGKVDCFFQLNAWKAYNFVEPVAGSDTAYLGTCEQYPLVQGLNRWNPVYNDVGGPLSPFDKEFQGLGKIIALDLNKFIQTNINTLLGGGEGIEDYLSRGTLLQANGLSFTLWLRFAYYGTANDISGGQLPPGEVYFCCSIPENGYDPIGTRTRKTRLVIEADPAYNVNDGGFWTYSTLPKYFTGLPSVG